MERKKYYGTDELNSISYLEFGSIDLKAGKKEIWGYWQDQIAYDFYMFSRYARDLFFFRDFFKEKNRSLDILCGYILKSAHNKIMDYIFKYAGVLTCIDKAMFKNNTICENGSSLYGLIDEVLACDEAYNNGTNAKMINQMHYLCSDISEMMNRGAQAFHGENTFSFSEADTIHELMKESGELALFYGLSVSLRYALRETRDIIDIAEKAELVIFNRLSLSFTETKSLVYGTGKCVYIISLPELIALLKQHGIEACYCTANMQYNRDGENSVRASIVISKQKSKMDKFIDNYNDLVMRSLAIAGVEEGKWQDLNELI